ncbi:hypothetical protein TNCV_791841, partial [Trichonephila clavipes]
HSKPPSYIQSMFLPSASSRNPYNGPHACPFLDESIRNVGERDSKKPFSPTSSGSNTIRFWSPT